MSSERFKSAEFTSIYNESSEMYDNSFSFYTLDRDDDHHIQFNFTSYKKIIAGPSVLTFVHQRTSPRRPKSYTRR